MNNKSVFKLIVLLITCIKVFVISLPLSLAIINLKQGKFQYGYDFFELNFNTAILISVALALVLSTWNAFEHADHKEMDQQQFMKSHQQYQLIGGDHLTHHQISEKLKELTDTHKRWKMLPKDVQSSTFKLEVKNIVGAKDVVTVSRVNDAWILDSRPKWRIEFIDLARNYKNILYISKKLSV